MQIYITSINFNYDDGIEEGFKNVSLHFQTSGFPYSINGKMTVTKEQYMTATNVNEVRQLVKDRIIADLGE